MGYVVTPDGQLQSISGTDLEFFKWGDDGVQPDVFSFSFTAGKERNIPCF